MIVNLYIIQKRDQYDIRDMFSNVKFTQESISEVKISKC